MTDRLKCSATLAKAVACVLSLLAFIMHDEFAELDQGLRDGHVDSYFLDDNIIWRYELNRKTT